MLPKVSACDVRQGHDDSFAQARAIHGRFYAGHKPRVRLDVVAEMGAADDALRTLAEGTANHIKSHWRRFRTKKHCLYPRRNRSARRDRHLTR